MEYCTHDILQQYVETWNFPTMLEECQSNYSFIKYMDLFYRHMGQQTIVAIAVVLFVASVCFLNIKYIADNFFSVSIKNIKHRFQISSVLTSCILIPVINGAPDLFCSIALGNKPNGVHTAIGILIASFMFSILVVIGFVAFVSKKAAIQISKNLYFKELAFYGLSIVLLLAFGIHGKITFLHSQAFLGLYILYLGLTLKWIIPDEFDNLSEVFVAYEKECKAESEVPKLAVSFGENLKKQLFGAELTLLSALKSPLVLLYTLTVPSEGNKLSKSVLAPVVDFFSILIFLWSFGLMKNVILCIFISYSVATIMAITAHHSRNLAFKNTMHELLTLAASIAWLKLIVTILMDSILFMSFLVNINQIYLSIFIVSIGNSLQDLFANVSLAKIGFEQIAIISTFSCQLCNLLLGLWLTTLTSHNKSFVLFDSGYQSDTQDIGSGLIFFFLACAIIVIFCSSIYFTWNDFEYRKSYFWIGIVAYALFLGASGVHIWMDRPSIRR